MNAPYESLINQDLLACLFDSNGNRNGHTNHGVVTCTDKSHHLNMGGHGGGACELSVAVHSSQGVGHAVGSRACCHVIGMQGTTRTVQCSMIVYR